MKKILNWMVLHLVGNRSVKGIKISHQLKYYHQFNKMQWNTLDENIEYQRKKLYQIIKFAIENVPYYRELKIGSISEETIFEDIKKFPILTKKIIRQEGDRMLPDCRINDWMYWDQSGGTTGEPLKVRHSGAFFDEGQGIALSLDQWAGRNLGDKQVRLWGNEKEIITGHKDRLNQIYRWMRNERVLNTFKLDDELMEKYLKEIEDYKPTMILAYVQSMRELALYSKRKGRETYSPKGIMTSAGTLTKELHEYLLQTFKCPIINRYGSREAGQIACSCEKNEGLHINMLSHYLEILDEKNEKCEEGRIVLTLLSEKAMPLIRYDIGDLGKLSDRQCSCGRGLQLLEKVSGRVVDVFKTADGKKIDGEYFTHILYTVPQVRQFQIIQDKIDHVLVKLVLSNDEVKRDFIDVLVMEIKKLLGEDVQIEVKEVDEIPPQKSGKRAYTISYV